MEGGSRSRGYQTKTRWTVTWDRSLEVCSCWARTCSAGCWPEQSGGRKGREDGAAAVAFDAVAAGGGEEGGSRGDRCDCDKRGWPGDPGRGDKGRDCYSACGPAKARTRSKKNHRSSPQRTKKGTKFWNMSRLVSNLWPGKL